MLAAFVLPTSGDLQCDHAQVDPTTQHALLVFSTTTPSVPCPLCQHPASRRHSRYRRTLADLPLADCTVQIHLHVRKFFCDNPACMRKIFTERVPTLAAPFAHRTLRVAAAQTRLGLALGGIAAARVSQHVHLPASRDTFLRLIRRAPLPNHLPPTSIGVDDWAIRKAHQYGSILVDLERQHILDLLPDRTPETVATWLQQHPSVQIVSRDRAAAYAEGISRGAPDAIQVADRFHLLQNLTETLREVFMEQRATLHELVRPAAPPHVPIVEEHLPPSPQVLAAREHRRSLRLQQYETITAGRQRGMTIAALAHQTGVSLRTIHRWLKTTSFPERQPRAHQPSQLDPYKVYLLERWNAGCWNGTQLYREIKAQGYPGKPGTVLTYCVQLRKAQGVVKQRQRPHDHATQTIPQARMPSVNQLVWLIMRPRDRRTSDDQARYARLTQTQGVIAQAIALAETFLAITRTRTGAALTGWLQDAEDSSLPAFQRFAAGIRRDLAAVQAGLTLSWSTGPVEGHINRLKTLKRQMYGRASLDLLKRRLLAG
jgi:transposase